MRPTTNTDLERSNLDALGLYMRGLANHLPLGAEEELNVAGTLATRRQHMRRVILRSGRAQRVAFQLLGRVQRRAMLPAVVVDVSYRDRAANDLILRRLSVNLKTIAGLLRRLDEDFRALAAQRNHSDLFPRVARRMLATRKRVATLLEETPLRTQHLLRLARGVLVAARKLAAARHECDGAGRVMDNRALASICRTSCETPGRLVRQAMAIQRAMEHYYAAKDKMIQPNLRLVVYLAREYTNTRLDMLDLIQEGNLGLMEAIDRFDYRRGFRFSTYAAWWIRQAITRAIAEKSSVIRQPHGSFRRIGRLRRVVESVAHAQGHWPTCEEVIEQGDLPPELLNEVGSLESGPFTIDSLCFDGMEYDGLHQKDAPAESTGEGIDDHELTCRINSLLEMLSHMEQEIVKLRYGLCEDPPYTLKEVGRIFNISGERVRQIESSAIRKLRKPASAKVLAGYVR